MSYGVRVRIPFRAPIANANPTEYSGENPPGRVFPRADSAVKVVCVICDCFDIGVSPSRSKASDFDSDIRRFESVYPIQPPQAGIYACIYAQMAKLVDAAASKAAAVRRCGFDPRSGHHKCRSVWQKARGSGGDCYHGKGQKRCEAVSLRHDNGQKSNTQPLYRELELRHIRAGFITKRFPERGVMRKHPQRVVQP